MKQLLVLICSLFSFSTTGCKQSTSNDGVIKVLPKDLNDILNNKDIQLVDVRTSKEFRGGHIAGSININFFSTNFRSLIEKRLDKEKPVYIYCRSGKRSAKSVKVFKTLGFKKIYDLKGGFLSWKEKDFTISTE